jgi:HEAT repeat protein
LTPVAHGPIVRFTLKENWQETMGLKCGLLAIVAVSILAPTAAADPGQEPYWQSKPLSYWVSALSAQDPVGRVRAASSLAEMAIAHGGGDMASAVPGLLPNLADPLADVRESAAHALEQIGAPAAVPAVATLLRLLNTDVTPQVRRRAALALGRIDPTSEDVIAVAGRTLRDDGDTAVRVSAAVLLMASGRSAERVSGELTAALTDDSHAVRLYSAAALVKTPAGQSAFPRLLEGLSDDDPALRAEAVALLADAGQEPERVMPALVQALGDDDAEVRGAAADALGSIGKPARPALPALWSLLRDPDESVRDRVVRAVRAIRRR